MKTYYVLTHAEKESKAIKDGFSWPAFFFPIPWALVKGLFGVAFMLFLTWVVLFSISYGIMVIAPEASSWLSLIFLLAKIVAGNLANDWLKEKLCESGYVLERKVEAKRPSQAIAALSNHPTIWIDPTIPLLGSKKESTQTSLIGGSPDAGGGKKSSGMIRILVGTAVLVLCVFGLNAAFKHYDRERSIREVDEIVYTLRIAWNERDVELAKSALQNDAWRYDPVGPSAVSDFLALSIYENEIAFVDLLTSFKGNLDTRMYGKMPPLHQAAYLGRPRIVELLLERGADAEKHWGEDEDSLTPFEFSLLPSRDEAADLEGKKRAAGILRDWIAPPNRPSLQQQSSTDSGKSEDSPSLLNQELADQSLNAKIEAIEANMKFSNASVDRLLEVAEQRDAEAQFNFGVLLGAAEQGDAEAQNNLGWCYENGEGIFQDYKEAVRWYRLAAEQGNSNAQENLGNCYRSGTGVPRDYEEAVKWYRLAAEQGNSNAQNNLGVCYQLGTGVPEDYAESLKWYHLAAEQGDSDAQFNLGNCYRSGTGVPQDDVIAFMWFNLAGASGHERAETSRETVSKGMTPEQIAAAQKLSLVWKPKG